MNRCIKITHKLCLGCGQERASFLRRWKSKKADHWAMVKRRQSGPALALKHFDHFYPETYGGARWRSMRLALLSRSKPAALVNHFGDVDGTCERLTAAGSLDLTAELRAQISRLRLSESSDADRTSSLPSPAHTSPISAGAATTSPTATAAAVALEAETAAEAEAEAAGRLRVLEPTDPSSSAVLHDYVPASQLHGDDDWLEEGDYFQFAQEDGSLRVALDRDGPVNIPETLRMLSFPAGDISRFPYPQTTVSGAKDYYPMDGASLLPVLALDVQPGDAVLDLCAAPGGKSLALLQTLRPESLVCNDTQAGRVRRLKQVLLDYLPPPDSWPCRVNVTKSDGRRMQEREQYDKVLVDVPCFSDRHVLADEENNLFAINRSRERIQIPQLQTDLLRRAIESVRPGGTVVYSTCTLSPVQNDGVVHMALKMLWEDTDVQVVVKDMTQAMRPFYGTFWFARGCGVKYGQMVLPSVVNNFGPMYFAKIVRVK